MLPAVTVNLKVVFEWNYVYIIV